MRVKLLCLCLCFVLFLTGCGATKEVQTKIKFDFDLESENGTFFINAEVRDGTMKYTVLSPENINGLTFVFSENRVDSSFLSHQQSFPFENGDFGVLGSLYKAFKSLNGALAQKRGDEFIAEVTAEGENYIFTVTEMGLPLSVKFANQEIFFKNITNL